MFSYIYVGFGFSVVTSQLMTAPPNIVSVIMVIVGGYIVDKYNRRAVVLATGFSIMALGYFLLYVLRDRWGKCHASHIVKAKLILKHIPAALYGALFVLPVGMALQGIFTSTFFKSDCALCSCLPIIMYSIYRGELVSR